MPGEEQRLSLLLQQLNSGVLQKCRDLQHELMLKLLLYKAVRVSVLVSILRLTLFSRA